MSKIQFRFLSKHYQEVVAGALTCLLLVFPLIVHAGVSIVENTNNTSSGEKRTFVITAYYTPLPGQARYAMGSYEGDVRMNGDYITASGTRVSIGTIAAPKSYKFGTKIYLEGLGLGTVEDRGGAIVHAGQRGYAHDRLDIWVGEGDAGLIKALTWGKRVISGVVYEKDDVITHDSLVVSNFNIGVSYKGSEKIRKSILDKLGYDRILALGDSGKDVENLNKMLLDLGFLNEDSPSDLVTYDTLDAVSNFLNTKGHTWFYVPNLTNTILTEIASSWIDKELSKESISTYGEDVPYTNEKDLIKVLFVFSMIKLRRIEHGRDFA